MRLDKFLKVSRIIKRRTLAKEICDAGNVEINGRPAKAGTDVKVGDKLAINFGHRILEVEILETKNNVPAAKAKEMYKEIR
ncbi:MAG: hypothetical protein PWQ96_975 [Clostridia bacterium]|jgi:ribosomal 50S subunit-recycling heat shock protein|nr:ribosome-associated heat shock protein [Clostridiales bacterium]MDK2985333.1 hypothetical protein [Clostridia bacterium]